MDEDFEASTMSDGLLDRKPRKRAVNLALSLEDLYKGGTKKLKVGGGGKGQGEGVGRHAGERVETRKEGRPQDRASSGADRGGGACGARTVV